MTTGKWSSEYLGFNKNDYTTFGWTFICPKVFSIDSQGGKGFDFDMNASDQDLMGT